FNLAAGAAATRDAFGRASNYYLPPEFMLMSGQVTSLAKFGVKGTFINAQRYESDMASRIPTRPYFVRGVMGSELGCIPVDGQLTPAYLRASQLWDIREWSGATGRRGSPLRLWRDGESSFLIPDGVEREDYWLANCTADRAHLGDEEYDAPMNSG